MKLIANISTLFTERPFCERIKAAAEAGFEGVEIQFPYGEELSDIQKACAESGMTIELINLPAGDWDAGDVGLAALPDRLEEFQQGMELALFWAKELKVKKVNVLSGKTDGKSFGLAFDTLVSNLARAANGFAEINVQVQLEVINSHDVPDFFAGDLDIGLAVVNEVNHPNLRLQFDFYHVVRLGHVLADAIKQAGKMIGHVQFADVPGRHEPGSGDIDFASAVAVLKTIGYDGTISAEYFPTGLSDESLGWMSDFKKVL